MGYWLMTLRDEREDRQFTIASDQHPIAVLQEKNPHRFGMLVESARYSLLGMWPLTEEEFDLIPRGVFDSQGDRVGWSRDVSPFERRVAG